jgi:hypothetical protein
MGIWEWKGMMNGGRGGGLYGFVEGEGGMGRIGTVKAEKEIVRDKAVLSRKDWNKAIVVSAAVLRKRARRMSTGLSGREGAGR